MKETVREYLQEMLDRKEKETNAASTPLDEDTDHSDKKEEETKEKKEWFIDNIKSRYI